MPLPDHNLSTDTPFTKSYLVRIAWNQKQIYGEPHIRKEKNENNVIILILYDYLT